MNSSPSLTPMMKQFFALKEQNPGFLLFFRLGDFYEMFEDDARIGSKILGLTLTKRQDFDMCGIPHHAKDNYLHKLIEAKVKVAICEQVEVIIEGKSSFDRKVTERLTPGTFHGDSPIRKQENSFLMSLFFFKKNYFFALADVNTGELFLGQAQSQEHMVSQIYQVSPTEILVSPSQKDLLHPFIKNSYHSFVQDKWFTSPEEEFLKSHFHTKSLSSIYLDSPATQGVIFTVLQYLSQNLFKKIVHLDVVKKISVQSSVWLNDTTIQNLDLLSTTQRGDDAKYSLFSHLNQTKTSIGKRYLRQLIVAPSTNIELIQNRLDQVEYFLRETSLTQSIRKTLAFLPDFQRLMAKLSLKTGNPKDVWALKLGLDQVQILWKLLPDEFLKNFTSAPTLEKLEQMNTYIASSLVEEPPIFIEGDPVFRETYSAELAELRKHSTQSYQILLDIEERERTKNNLSRLRIRYNKILGYYIELSKTEAPKAPPYFIRKQTLSNLERFTTEELLNFEAVVVSSKTKLIEMEKDLFEKHCIELLNWLSSIQTLVSEIQEIDIITTFAHISSHSQYTRPQMLENGPLHIEEGRHPVVEKYTSFFTPNSVTLDDQSNRLWIISGPNMAGKSTFLRQCAIIVLMAHMGCFVPATEARIPITDQIFTRIGSSDNLAKGESTFLVEMAEVSAILNYSTERSFVIMDELGRGTSTNDGLALCWSIVEYLCDPKEFRGKILFSTHYHELASLEDALTGVKNYQMSVQETDNDIVFLHKVVHGAATQSYGIHVASLAGIPDSVIARAKSIMASLNSSNSKESLLSKKIPPMPQSDLKKNTTSPLSTHLIQDIQALDLNKMTGIDALVFLQNWKKKTKKNMDSPEKEDPILF